MTTIVFRVTYPYYQHNTGSGNNGYGPASVDRSTLEKAEKLAEQIKQSQKDTNTGIEQSTNVLEILGLDGEGHISKGEVSIAKVTTIVEKIS